MARYYNKAEHPIEQFTGVYVVRQRPDDAARYDDNLLPTQNCLTMISAAAQGWSYFDLLHKMSESRRQ